MLTIVFVTVMFALLVVVGIFAMMAKQQPRGSKGITNISTNGAEGAS